MCVIPKKTVVATHENYDSAISSLIVQVICCVWLPVLGRSSTWPIKKKKTLVALEMNLGEYSRKSLLCVKVLKIMPNIRLDSRLT